MFGFFNQVLSVDLSESSATTLPLSDDILKETLGGKGLATHLLLAHNPPGVDPLSPLNHLIFATGPVTGTAIWGSCRHGIFTKSPQTGGYSESYSGGKAAEPMAATGFDAVMLKGASTDPVWVEISPKGAAFHDARDLWGLDTYETEDRLKAWMKEQRPQAKRPGVVVIGPAGENLVRFAVIENDYWRSAGRTGVGAVMGSKKIKGIVFWGDAGKGVAHRDRVKAFAKAMAAKAKEDAGVGAYKSMGTPMLVDVTNNMNCFPSRYWREGTVPHRDKINAAALHDRCRVKPNACLKCFMACGRLATVKSGRHAGLTIEGPEYETIFAFGGLCGVETIEEIAYLNDICDRLGLDTISAGNLAGLAIDASRQGKIHENLPYGNVDKIAALLKDMAYNKGLGGILSQGIKSAAKQMQMADQAIHVKGLEPAGYDPRVLKGMGLAYGTSDRGACHLRATFYKPELAGIVEIEQIEGKAEIFTQWEDRLTFFDTLVMCRFYRDLYQWEQLQEIINGVTGLDLAIEDMVNIAKRTTDQVRRFNLREGLTALDDQLPPRFHDEPLPETDKVITRDQMNTMLKEYYQVRGWDSEGRPL